MLTRMREDRLVTRHRPHRTLTQRVRHAAGYRDGVRLCDGACGRPIDLWANSPRYGLGR